MKLIDGVSEKLILMCIERIDQIGGEGRNLWLIQSMLHWSIFYM